ncbi:SOS response-associated peptidase family protein, partial [Ramlibacter sp.]
GIGPWQPGPFVHREGVSVGQWGLIPWFATARRPTGKGGRPISTNNCRVETAPTAPSFKGPWSRGQRCLIPAIDWDEPYWGTGRNIWWRFARSDGQPWALAGLWTDWTDPATGEVLRSYTMLTQNCDAHPLLSLMHKPEPSLPADAQDKRAVVPIEQGDWRQWLEGTLDEALQLVRLPPLERIAHDAADPSRRVPLPGLGPVGAAPVPAAPTAGPCPPPAAPAQGWLPGFDA